MTRLRPWSGPLRWCAWQLGRHRGLSLSGTDSLDVAGDLSDQFTLGLETALPTHKTPELYANRRAVEVPVKVEEVRLHEALPGLVVVRATPHRDGRQVAGAVLELDHAGIDPVREIDARSDLQVGCREAKFAPATVTHHDDPLNVRSHLAKLTCPDCRPGARGKRGRPHQVHTLPVTYVTASRFRARAVDHLSMAIGTTKGLFFVIDSTVDGPLLAGERVGAFVQLPTGRLLAASNDAKFGSNVRASDDGGLTWGEPGARPVAFPADIGTELVSVWQLHADQRPNAAETVWAGVEPAALFRSDDGGDTFTLVRGLWDHPDRPSWKPGFCGLGLHTVLTHPDRPHRVVVAVSTGGVYRSDDGGDTWVARNQGIEARIPMEQSPILGQCVHKIALGAENPDVMWAQNHWGIYRTEDAGDHWESVGHLGEPGSLPSEFGFPIVAAPDEAGTAYVLPLQSDTYPCTPEGRCRVYRTIDDGLNWEPLSDGLPGGNAHLTVLRDAFTIGVTPPCSLAFGSTSGHVFASVDTGESWRLVASYLPPILCVRVLD